MDNNFFSLLKYSEVPELNLSPPQVIKELKYLLHHEFLNAGCYNYIDYEKLIYIELTYKEDKRILELLNELKEKINFNYIQRKKLLNRI